MKKTKTFLFIAVVGISFSALSGCASIVGGTKQSVSITTTPVEGAQVVLSNNEGKWYGTTPCSVLVHRSCKDLLIYCHKPGYQDMNTHVKSTTKGAVFGNILLGGVAGACIDTVDGAAFRYPHQIQIPMQRE